MSSASFKSFSTVLGKQGLRSATGNQGCVYSQQLTFQNKVQSTNDVRHYSSSSVLRKKKDYYEALGVPKNASKEDIKKSFRNMAKKYHPDLNKNDKTAETKFKEISEAYEVLEDDKKRQQYDSFGHDGVDLSGNGAPGGMHGNPFNGFGGFGGFGGFRTAQGGSINTEDLFDFFNQAMGGQGAGGVGQDVKTVIRLTFLEAVTGCSKEVKYEYFIREPIAGKPGQFQKIRKSKTAKIDIPAGVDTGVNMRVAGKGAEGQPNYPPGDLMVQLEVAEDPYFRRDELDVHVDAPISISQVRRLMKCCCIAAAVI